MGSQNYKKKYKWDRRNIKKEILGSQKIPKISRWIIGIAEKKLQKKSKWDHRDRRKKLQKKSRWIIGIAEKSYRKKVAKGSSGASGSQNRKSVPKGHFYVKKFNCALERCLKGGKNHPFQL